MQQPRLSEQGGSPRSRSVSPPSSLSEQAIENITTAVTCGLCAGPVASSLVLSCSHLFCGDCLFKSLQAKQACPTCNLELRAIPVRVSSLDKVAASIVPELTAEQQAAYNRRQRDGSSAADKINKMFWWLTPPAAGPAPAGLPGTGLAGPGPQFGGAGIAPPGLATLPLQPQAASMPAQLGPQGAYGALAGFAGAGCVAPHLAGLPSVASAHSLLQLAQLAHAQHALGLPRQAPGLPALGLAPGMLLGHDSQAYLAAAGLASAPMAAPGQLYASHDQLQLGSMMGSMCQV